MAGNTRGKLKENFEGVHRNFNWSIKHLNKSLDLIAVQLMQLNPDEYKKESAEETEAALMTYSLYKGIKSLGIGIEALDGLAQKIYASI
ncbi:unnamed protein product [marine sediment metagenome]|uniref:Uncharacterized protein n=1 Tax=marine sediment metagenome TaxID=412755 RepID=X1RND0_9ZZZZ